MSIRPVEACLRVLACVARADGEVRPEESARMLAIVAASEVSDAVRERVEAILDMSRPFDVALEIATLAPSLENEVLLEVLRDAYVIAAVDGEIVPLETDVIDRLLEARNIGAGDAAALHTWARRSAGYHVEGLALLAGLEAKEQAASQS